MKKLSLLKIYLVLISFVISASIFIDTASATPKTNFTILPTKHFAFNEELKGALIVLDQNDGSIWAYAGDFGFISADKWHYYKELGLSSEDISKIKIFFKPLYLGKMNPGKLIIVNDLEKIVKKRMEKNKFLLKKIRELEQKR